MLKKINENTLIFLLIIFKYHLRFFYFFIKLFTIRKKRVFFLSRQSNKMELNYELLAKELKKEKIEYQYMCKKVPSSINILIRNEKKKKYIFKQALCIIKYYFSIYKQMYYCATSKVIIVDGYNISASLLKHKKNTTIIQLWHALGAIKKFGYQTIGTSGGTKPKIAKILCMHKNYDYIISGTEKMNKYFKEAFNSKSENIIACGTPTLDYLLNKNEKTINKLYKQYPILKEKKNILYSPTFRNDGSNNYQEVINNFNYTNYNLILTFHPKNNTDIKNDNIICINKNDFPVYDILKISDYVITDYSALIIDACAINKKILLYVYDYDQYKKETGLNIDIFKELKGNVSKSFNQIMSIIENNTYNNTSYEQFKQKYSPDLTINSTKEITKLIKENL